MKPICLDCKLFYSPHRNGAYFTEGIPDGRGGWKPYKVWHGDIWKCKGCGHEIIVGVAHLPVIEHYEDDFNKWMEQTGADQININDC